MFTQNDFTQSTLPKQSNAKQYVLYTFIFLIVLALGVLIGLEIPVIRHRTYNDGWNAAKARLAESEQFGFLEAERETKVLDGIVVEINGNQIAVETEPLSPLADPELTTRFVGLLETTKVTKIISRDTATYQKEFEAYMKNAQTGKNNPDAVMPASFTVLDAKITDVKIGDRVVVTAGENIGNLKKFGALEIQIQ